MYRSEYVLFKELKFVKSLCKGVEICTKMAISQKGKFKRVFRALKRVCSWYFVFNIEFVGGRCESSRVGAGKWEEAAFWS